MSQMIVNLGNFKGKFFVFIHKEFINCNTGQALYVSPLFTNMRMPFSMMPVIMSVFFVFEAKFNFVIFTFIKSALHIVCQDWTVFFMNRSHYFFKRRYAFCRVKPSD